MQARPSNSTPVHARWWLAGIILALANTVHATPADPASGPPPATGTGRNNPTEELIYSVNRSPESLFETARAAQIITAEEIRRKNARTLPELLMEEAGIFVQQTNYGGGSPIIRGLIGKEILILVDGIRLNNATYRFGPIQYLGTIDLGAIDRIEIVRGPDAVLSGFALGGVINVVTKKGLAEDDLVAGSVSARYSSADRGTTGHAEVAGHAGKLRYLAGASYRNSDDVEGGGQQGRQVGTGYDESGANVHFDYSFSRNRSLAFGYLALEQDDVPRTDRIANGNNLVFDFDPQRLQLASVVYEDLTARGWSDSLNLTLSWNQQDEGIQEVRSDRPTTERRMSDSQRTFGLGVELSTFLGRGHRLLYGVDYSTEEIASARTDVNLVTGAETARRGQLTDGASYDTLGLYLQDRFNLGKLVTMTLGARWSSFATSGTEDSSVGRLDLEGTQSELTGSATLAIKASERTRVFGSVSRAFRGANIDDVSVFDARPEGTEVPNPSLHPETMVTYELGVRHQGARLSGAVFYFHSDLNNLIERSAGTFRGLPFFDANGNGVRDPGEAAVLQKQNLGTATIDGVELELHYRIATNWAMAGNWTATRGDDTTGDTPLSRIPPAFGALKLQWSGPGGRAPWAEAVYHFAGSQRRISPRDAGDDRIGPGGTDGFGVVHLRGGLGLTDALRATLAVENLFDDLYKYHSSGVFRPGRQLVLGVDVRF